MQYHTREVFRNTNTESVKSMKNLFSPDNKFMQLGAKLFDLISLQIAVMLFSLPLFTAGAAFTAMHYVLLKIYRDQSTSVWKEFWISFKDNFRQSTVIWLLSVLIFVFLFVDFRLLAMSEATWSTGAMYLLLIPVVYLLLGISWVFVLQSRYSNTLGTTVKNALATVFAHPFYTIINAVLMIAPLAVLILYFQALPPVFFLGFTLPGTLRAILYSRVFDDLEGTDWRKEMLIQETTEE